jgi:hypothetical protein
VFFWRSFQYVTSTVSGERVRAFVPAPLPPGTRALDLASVQTILAEANQAIGRLDGLTSAFPDLKLFSTPTTERGWALRMNRCAMVAKLERSRQTPPARFLTTPTSISSYFVLFHSRAVQVDLIR